MGNYLLLFTQALEAESRSDDDPRPLGNPG